MKKPRNYKNWGIHNCFFDKECRSYGAPWARLYINTPWVFITLALAKSGTMSQLVRGEDGNWLRGETGRPVFKTKWIDFKKLPRGWRD